MTIKRVLMKIILKFVLKNKKQRKNYNTNTRSRGNFHSCFILLYTATHYYICTDDNSSATFNSACLAAADNFFNSVINLLHIFIKEKESPSTF